MMEAEGFIVMQALTVGREENFRPRGRLTLLLLPLRAGAGEFREVFFPKPQILGSYFQKLIFFQKIQTLLKRKLYRRIKLYSYIRICRMNIREFFKFTYININVFLTVIN